MQISPLLLALKTLKTQRPLLGLTSLTTRPFVWPERTARKPFTDSGNSGNDPFLWRQKSQKTRKTGLLLLPRKTRKTGHPFTGSKNTKNPFAVSRKSRYGPPFYGVGLVGKPFYWLHELHLLASRDSRNADWCLTVSDGFDVRPRG